MTKGVDVSQVLPELLKERGMSQEDLADKTGILRTTINAYCTGKRLLGARNAERIASALGVSADVLLPPVAEEPALALVLHHLERLRAEAELSRGAAVTALEGIRATLARIEGRLPGSGESTPQAGQS